MALPVCQFVDRVGTGAIQRLNLNDGEKLTLLAGPGERPGPDFSPPALKRAVVNTLMVEGASIPASAYDLRIIRLPLRVEACNEAEMAEILESLHRELDRGNNILKWHPTYNSRPVYFRTFRSPDYRLDQTMEGRGELKATLSILAEPFAYGDYIEQTGTIYNDPAAVANGIHFEIAATEGDVPTPLFLHVGALAQGVLFIGTRRHGTPALYWSQCEAMVQDIDTAIQANDATASGPGQNWSQTTFAGVPGEAIRLTWNNVPAAGNDDDYRGLYRVFVRVRTTSGDEFSIRLAVRTAAGQVIFEGDWTSVTHLVAPPPWLMVDLGLLPIPVGPDPVYDGYRGVILPTDSLAQLDFRARRDVGAGNLDWDYAVLIPADEEFGITDFFVGSTNNILDGPNDVAYYGDLSVVNALGEAAIVGSIPLVTPNQTNLYVAIQGRLPNVIANNVAYTARYWPRYLYVR